jgi:hypothetical protein
MAVLTTMTRTNAIPVTMIGTFTDTGAAAAEESGLIGRLGSAALVEAELMTKSTPFDS